VPRHFCSADFISMRKMLVMTAPVQNKSNHERHGRCLIRYVNEAMSDPEPHFIRSTSGRLPSETDGRPAWLPHQLSRIAQVLAKRSQFPCTSQQTVELARRRLMRFRFLHASSSLPLTVGHAASRTQFATCRLQQRMDWSKKVLRDQTTLS
jgi:hypothetical protein